jgi:hypothetical protein
VRLELIFLNTERQIKQAGFVIKTEVPTIDFRPQCAVDLVESNNWHRLCVNYNGTLVTLRDPLSRSQWKLQVLLLLKRNSEAHKHNQYKKIVIVNMSL